MPAERQWRAFDTPPEESVSEVVMEPAESLKVYLVVVDPAPLDQWIAIAGTQTEKGRLVHIVDRVIHAAIIGAGYSTTPDNRKSARVSRTVCAKLSRVVVLSALV